MSPVKSPFGLHRRSQAALGLGILLVVAILLRIWPVVTPPSIATADLPIVRTEAVGTFAEGLTRTAKAVPAPTGSGTPTASPIGTGSASPACMGLRFLRDVTIPDNTEMTPAQVFTKTWLVENSGACPWRPGFEVVLTGGLAMGGSPFKLAQSVGPGTTIQVSIKMAAPTTQSGVVQGTWKMSDDKGISFGDYLSVVLVLRGGKATPEAIPPTATP